MATILTITGSDSTGGAGIQADIKTITSLGAEAMSVVTCVTMQNTLGIQEFYDIPPEVVECQIDAVADDTLPQVWKIGMIRNIYTLEAVMRSIRRYRPKWLLFSPVVFSSHEEQLMSDELVHKIQEELIPLCSVVVVRKRDAEWFEAHTVIEAADNHGRCNELTSAIAVFLSQGNTRDDAISKAQHIIPAKEINTELSSRTLSLYREFISLQTEESRNSHDVNYYSDRLNVSARYLSQVTKKVSGQSPKAIIDSTLLQNIKKLLSTDCTIQEIAYRLEFSSQAHLTNFFKKLAGMTPTEFRRMHD